MSITTFPKQFFQQPFQYNVAPSYKYISVYSFGIPGNYDIYTIINSDYIIPIENETHARVPSNILPYINEIEYCQEFTDAVEYDLLASAPYDDALNTTLETIFKSLRLGSFDTECSQETFLDCVVDELTKCFRKDNNACPSCVATFKEELIRIKNIKIGGRNDDMLQRFRNIFVKNANNTLEWVLANRGHSNQARRSPRSNIGLPPIQLNINGSMVHSKTYKVNPLG